MADAQPFKELPTQKLIYTISQEVLKGEKKCLQPTGLQICPLTVFLPLDGRTAIQGTPYIESSILPCISKEALARQNYSKRPPTYAFAKIYPFTAFLISTARQLLRNSLRTLITTIVQCVGSRPPSPLSRTGTRVKETPDTATGKKYIRRR